MRTIVVTNERGGIGKTTLTCHIAWHLAEQGKRVVVLDLDKQCHSAGMLKAEFEQIGPVQSILDFDPNEEPPALACFKNTRQIVELTDRKSVVKGKSGAVCVDIGGGGIVK